jgi:glycosyltransferase involved in cell wall biosynthesis
VQVARRPAFLLGLSALVQGRTRRAVEAAGFDLQQAVDEPHELADLLQAVEDVCLVVQEGVWLPGNRNVPRLPAHGRWAGAGAWVGPGEEADEWSKCIDACGGDLSMLAHSHSLPCAPPALLLSRDAAGVFATLLRQGASLDVAWHQLLGGDVRAFHLEELDGDASDRLRIVQLVTSIQIGGAERVALDLTVALPDLGISTLLATAGRPLRQQFPAPPGLVDLSGLRGNIDEFAQAVREVALEFGADLVHAHLLNAAEARAVSATGVPLVLHLHNHPQGWPTDYSHLQSGDTSLLIGCAMSVEREATRLLPALRARTVWNGIVPTRRSKSALGQELTVVTFANPRPQKRLDRIPAIARATAALVAPRRVRFLIAGAKEAHSVESAQALASLRVAMDQHDAEDLVELIGIVTDPCSLLAGAHAALSVSDYEGLSLAHLEALSAGVPLVSTDAGGTREIAAQSESVSILPCDAPPERFASLLAGCLPGTAQLPASFTRQRMAERVAWISAAVSRAAQRKPGNGLWLIANNFSTGGAQSSARRLILSLMRRGVRVRVATIQEQPQYPTKGSCALVAAGVRLVAIPPSDGRTVEESAEPLLEEIERDPPQAVFFWNVITSWKVMLADALLGMRVFDVSPGEMLFSSLERFFGNVAPGLPIREERDYGTRLAGVVVKYAAEAPRATKLGAPVSVIPNGIDLADPVAHGPRNVVVLGTAARLSPDKRLDQLLGAIKMAAPSMPPFVLRIAGGPERDFPGHAEELHRMAEGLPVEWCGDLGSIHPFLQQLDVFVMISEPAGCPNATLEAAAAGLPVVATDHGGASEQVIDGATGFVVGRGDMPGFAKAIVALARDAELRARMGAAARQHVGERFSMDSMTDAYLRLVDAGASRCVEQQGCVASAAPDEI